MIWWAVLSACAACYLIKLCGLSVPQRYLSGRRMERIASLLPLALLTTLVVVQTFSTGQHLTLDARVAGLATGVVAVRLRAPFLVVVMAATAVTALVRHLT